MSLDSTAFLYPAYKDDNQTRGGLGRVCAIGTYRSIGHVEFPKSQPELSGGRWGGGTSDNFCWVCAASLSEIPTPL